MSQAEAGVEAASEALASLNARLAELRAAGADRLDPTAMHFLEALARRAVGQSVAVQRVLETRMEQAAASLEARLQQARARASEMLSAELQLFPQAEENLQPHVLAGDLPGLKRALFELRAQSRSQAMSALTRQLEQESARQAGVPAVRPELKTLRNARSTWSRLSADKQVAQALTQAPKNAGPINSHMLMLRSLELMRELSPDYLHRFISYADSLLRLEESAPKPAPKQTAKPAANQATKSGKVDKPTKRVRSTRGKTA